MSLATRLRLRGRPPVLFMGFWSVSVIALTCYMAYRIQLPWWESDPLSHLDRALPGSISEANFDAIRIAIHGKKSEIWPSSILECTSLFGSPGEAVTGPEWPDKLSGISGWEIEAWTAELGVTWRRWTDPAVPSHWIAVGFVALGGNSEPWAVAKRKNGF